MPYFRLWNSVRRNTMSTSSESSGSERAALYRQRAAEIEQKALTARTETMQRAWRILAEDWRKMADREELKFLLAPEAKLSPADGQPRDDVEHAIRQLAAQKVGKRVGD
jgi:hypothetical protein